MPEGSRKSALPRFAGLAASVGDRVAVRVRVGMIQVPVEGFENHRRKGVFQTLGLVVDLGPVELQRLHKKSLNEPVSPQHINGGLPGGQLNASEPLVLGELRRGHALTIVEAVPMVTPVSVAMAFMPASPAGDPRASV